MKAPVKITGRQRRALELYLRQVADELNDAGYTVQLALKERMDISWSHDLVKELLWRPMQKAITKKHSTKLLNKAHEIDNIYEHLNRHLGEKFGLHVPFPHFESEEDYIKSTLK